jgi:hypothetical protein
MPETSRKPCNRPAKNECGDGDVKKKGAAGTKRQRPLDDEDIHSSAKKVKFSRQPLKGMVLAVSTTKNKVDGDQHARSYQNVCAKCQNLGATISSQVSKKVTALIASEDAIQQATQRVRKAGKKAKPILSIAWLEECEKEGRKLEFGEYSLTDRAKTAIQNYDGNKQVADADGPVVEEDPNAGWSEPVSLGCCCVCHEMGTTQDCEWCKTSTCCSGGGN